MNNARMHQQLALKTLALEITSPTFKPIKALRKDLIMIFPLLNYAFCYLFIFIDII